MKQTREGKREQVRHLRLHHSVGALLVCLAIGLCGCPPKLYINNSFRQASTVPVASGMVSLSRGESIEVKEILKKEKLTPPKMIVTRLFGSYFMTADGFQFVWRIAPAGREKGSYTKVTVPGGKLTQPKFQHSESHNCLVLLIGEPNAQKKWFIHPNGHVEGKCNDVSSN